MQQSFICLTGLTMLLCRHSLFSLPRLYDKSQRKNLSLAVFEFPFDSTFLFDTNTSVASNLLKVDRKILSVDPGVKPRKWAPLTRH